MIENELSTHASSPTEGAPAPVSMGGPGGGAGAILRSYRESAGIHIVALASALKVTRAKLEALENDRYEELPDVVFARALAMSCCRYLGQDPESVLARMPSHDAQPAPGLRQHQLGNGMTPRPSFGPSRGPFASSKVPSWAIWALVLAAIVIGGWFAASPQRMSVRAPAPALDFPPPGADVLPGQAGLVAPEAPASGAATQNSVVTTPAAVPAVPTVQAPVQVNSAIPGVPTNTPGVRIEPVTPTRP
jgi:cytoskeleton protein RodZ